MRGTVGRLEETALRPLFRTPPPEFVTARNELVKELRRAKERESATAVAALRRPPWSDWALNVVAAEGAAVEAFATAAEALREAQTAAMESRSGPDVRASLQELRNQTGALVRRADEVFRGQGRKDGSAELTARLAEIAGSPAATDQLRRGLLGSADAEASDPFAGLEPAAPPTRRSTKQPTKRSTKRGSASKASEAAPPPSPTRSERRRLTDALEAAERALAQAQDEQGEVEAEVQASAAAVADTKRWLAEAEQRLQRAEQQLEQSAAQAARAETARDEARDEAEAALEGRA